MQYAFLILVFFCRSTAILLMLCNALARGLILCWIPKQKLAEKKDNDAATDGSKKAAAKEDGKADVIQSPSVDPSGLPDIKAALEVQSPQSFLVCFSLLSYVTIHINYYRHFCKK